MITKFKLNSKKRVQTATNAKKARACKVITFEKLCRYETSDFAVVVSTDENNHELIDSALDVERVENLENLSYMINMILRRYPHVLKVLKSLPPPKPFDYSITLIDTG